jgi:arginyl-tRNA---protein transferase
MYATCCPAYTIRLEASNFKISKKQRQVVRRIERFLECDSILQCDQEQCRKNAESITDPATNGSVSEEHSHLTIGSTHKPSKTKKTAPADEPITRKKAHILTYETTAAEFTTERYELYKKYQVAVHGDNPNAVTPSGFKRFLVESPLYDSSSPPSPNPLLSEPEIEMQKAEKSESESEASSGLKKENLNDDNSDCTKSSKTWKLGTYHQLHRLDGRLVAVGVVDIIPSGLSSVYLFYDPEEKLLSLGMYCRLLLYVPCLSLDVYYLPFFLFFCHFFLSHFTICFFIIYYSLVC